MLLCFGIGVISFLNKLNVPLVKFINKHLLCHAQHLWKNIYFIISWNGNQCMRIFVHIFVHSKVFVFFFLRELLFKNKMSSVLCFVLLLNHFVHMVFDYFDGITDNIRPYYHANKFIYHSSDIRAKFFTHENIYAR
jgi:hypothetical protein